MCVTSFLSLMVYTFRENREFVFVSIVQFMMSANSRIRFGLQIVFACLYITPSHYHHCANFIRRHWACQIQFVECVSKIKHISQLSIIQYVGLCVFSLLTSFVMIGRIYILCLIIIIKSEVWTITHCLGLGHETMVCAVCLSIFFHLLTSTVRKNCCCRPISNFHSQWIYYWWGLSVPRLKPDYEVMEIATTHRRSLSMIYYWENTTISFGKVMVKKYRHEAIMVISFLFSTWSR